MSDRPDNEQLLRDIFAEDTPPGFRETLLDSTLSLARRRRRFRQARRSLAATGLVLAVFLAAWRWLMPSTRLPESARPYVLVRTQPLPPQAVIATRPLLPTSLVASSATPNVLTTARAGYRVDEIDDEELLALAAPNPVVLVRHSPHQAELVFADVTNVH